MMDKIEITKLDAVRRQLITAIRLYFNDGDIVSVHTLAAAAFRITQDMCHSDSSLPKPVSDSISEVFIPGFEKIFWNKVNETANFFKHADRDPDDVHEFSSESTGIILFLGTIQYTQLTAEPSAEFMVLKFWFLMQHPEFFNVPPQVDLSKIDLLRKDLILNDRRRFWREVMPIVQMEIYKSVE